MKNTLWNITVGAAFVFAVFGLTYTPAPPPPTLNAFDPLTEEQLHIADVCLGLPEAEQSDEEGSALCRFIPNQSLTSQPLSLNAHQTGAPN